MKKTVSVFCMLLLTTSVLTLFDSANANPVIPSFNPDSWTSKASMQQARGGVGVAAVNGKIYAIGGSNAKGPYRPDSFAGDFLGTNEMYDPETDTWTYRTQMPTPRAHFAIATFENKIYCIGGSIGFNVDEYGFYTSVLSGVTEAYDTTTDTWETKNRMPDEAMDIQAHVVDGRIYVMDWSLVYVYDPEKDLWSEKTRMPPPYPWSSPVSAVVDKKIVVTGEFRVGWNYTSEQRVMIYDTEKDSWSEGAPGPILVGLGAAGATVGVKVPQKVYVLGFRGRPLNQVYDPKMNLWASAAAMSTNRSDFGVAVVNDVLYAIGGYDLTSHAYTGIIPVAVNERYMPFDYGVPPEITVLSPVDQVYNVSDVSFIFALNKPFSWSGYSLNGKENVTVSGNTTLSGLPNGLHSLTVYANDTFGNMGASGNVSFTVATPEPFPTIPALIIVVACVVVACAGLLLIRKSRKRSQVHG